jgi:hypothetical protein
LAAAGTEAGAFAQRVHQHLATVKARRRHFVGAIAADNAALSPNPSATSANTRVPA